MVMSLVLRWWIWFPDFPWTIILLGLYLMTQGPSWWFMHLSAKTDSSTKDSVRLAEQIISSLLLPLPPVPHPDFSRLILWVSFRGSTALCIEPLCCGTVRASDCHPVAKAGSFGQWFPNGTKEWIPFLATQATPSRPNLGQQCGSWAESWDIFHLFIQDGNWEVTELHSVTQSCLTLCDPMDCSPPGSSAHGILQARILEWVAMPSSRGYSQPRDRTPFSSVSCIDRWVLLPVHHLRSWRRLKNSK